MRQQSSIIIILITVLVFGSVVWLTEVQRLTGVTLFLLWIGAFIITTILITVIKVWQLRGQQTDKEEPHDQH
ncbi:hypothetical protein [Furfurilactobacillus curtus]|uniref:Uncharacterized protein n=1 Tax=Furfurilactobacillus curtus TaxID=1746200 RepID=A0ABQ5JKJ3_9LACO